MKQNKLRVTKPRSYACADCDAKAVYFDLFDTFACLICDQWLDPCDCVAADGCVYPELPNKPSHLVRAK